MREYTIYAENPQSFRVQFNQFLEDNPHIEIQAVYTPEEERKKDWTQIDGSSVALTIVYEQTSARCFH